MSLDPSQRAEIVSSFERAKRLPDFASKARWLTYYLIGRPTDLEAIGKPLAANECSNLGGWDGGFLYAKQPAMELGGDVALQIENVLGLCGDHSVEALHVDLDTSPDVTRSCFKCLIEFNR